MYDKMKKRVESVVESGKVGEYMEEVEHEAFSNWRNGLFTPQDHPTVIQVCNNTTTLVVHFSKE